MNETINNLITRRSVRSFQKEQISEEQLNEILTAGTYAPTVVVVLGDSTIGTYLEDGALVMGNLLNAANAVGVDSCWIHRAKEVFMSTEGKELLKQWGIDEKYVGIGNCILGYGKEPKPEAKPRKDNYIYRV